MIQVHLQPEPHDFDAKVRQPGLEHLRLRNVDPGQRAPQGHRWKPTWRKCAKDLYREYRGICAYFGVRIGQMSGAPEPDHFRPKGKAPARLAYEWNNYRLACQALNQIKLDKVLPIDPFDVEDDWFFLNPLRGNLYPNPDLDDSLKTRILQTIDMLHLSQGAANAERLETIDDYCTGRLTIGILERDFPLIYKELDRQALL